MVGRYRRRETSVIDDLHEMLNGQDEEFDESDLLTIEEFISSAPEPQAIDNWTRIVSAVEAQAEFDEDVAVQLARLKAWLAPVHSRAETYGTEKGIEDPVLFFVGAGGSAPEPTAIPTVRDMLPILWNKAEEIGSRPLLRLRDQSTGLNIESIEDLLSAIYLAQGAVGNPKIAALLRFLLSGTPIQPEAERSSRTGQRSPGRQTQRTATLVPDIDIVESLQESVQTLFSVLVGMMVGRTPNDIHNSIATFCRKKSGSTVVTTNYDVCIETALGTGNFQYGADQRVEHEPLAEGATAVLKLHGSLNWYACRSCDRDVAADVDSIDNAYKAGLYPVIAMCRSCQATSQQLIVPPIAQKYQSHPLLLEVRQAAEEALRAAKTVVVVGYSFTEDDEYILRMFSRAAELNPEKTVLVFDQSRQAAVKLRRFLGTHARNYNVADNVIDFTGDGAVVLPAFVNGILEEPESELLSQPESEKTIKRPSRKAKTPAGPDSA